MSIKTEIQLLSPTAMVDLYVLDLSGQGGPTHHFHAGTNELEGDVYWQGERYYRYPILATGFDKASSGALPRPKLQVANIGGTLAAEARIYGDFLGGRLTRKRTFARFLDAVNFAGGNPTADPTQQLPDELWLVDRKSMENPQLMEFELASPLDLAGTMLPRRQFIENVCSWVYRDDNCGYAGGPVATETGYATSDPALDKCGKRLVDCKLRHPPSRSWDGTISIDAILPYGGFPGVGMRR